MMGQLFTNNASTRLAAGISSGATSLSVTSGEGALFPSITSPDFFLITLEDSSKNREIVKVTARTGDNFTIVRGQQGTSQRAFSANDIVELRLTAGFIDAIKQGSISLTIDGGGTEIATGFQGWLEVPFDCTIDSVTALVDVTGNIVIDIWKDTYANFPPTDADSITGASPVTISSSNKVQDSTLTGWTVELTKGDILAFNVDSISGPTVCSVSLAVERS